MAILPVRGFRRDATVVVAVAKAISFGPFSVLGEACINGAGKCQFF